MSSVSFSNVKRQQQRAAGQQHDRSKQGLEIDAWQRRNVEGRAPVAERRVQFPSFGQVGVAPVFSNRKKLSDGQIPSPATSCRRSEDFFRALAVDPWQKHQSGGRTHGGASQN